MRSKSFVLLNDILNEFPKRIELLLKVIECDDSGVYISKGFHGLFANILKVKLCYKRKLEIYKEAPLEPVFSYNIILVRNGEFKCDNVEELFPQQVCVSSSFCYLIGSIVTDGIASHDIDLLVRKGTPSWLFQHVASSLVISHTNGGLFHIIEDSGLGPLTKYCSLYDLILERVK